MGSQRVLQAARAVALVASLATVATVARAAPPRTRERVAILDLGPDDPSARRRIAEALVAAGLDPVGGDQLEDALAGADVDRDRTALAAALAEAQGAYGRLDCAAADQAARQAIGLAAQRQAAGLAVPELPRAWTYALLCADRAGDFDRAMTAAARLRALGGSADVPAELWTKYPEVDTVLDRELVSVEITADVPDAAIWIDFRPAGTAPVQALLPAGEHVIAAAAGTRRGWAAGTAVASQPRVTVTTTDVAGPWSEVARRVASWHGQRPTPRELGWVLAHVHARVAVVRHGETIEAFGRIGLAEAPHRLGDQDGDGTGTLADAKRIAGLIADRVQTWNDRAPDPDRPLLVEQRGLRRTGDGPRDEPTRWWVYASLAGAVVAGAALIYATEAGGDRQRIEVHLP